MGWLRKIFGTPADYRDLFPTEHKIKKNIKTEDQLYLEWLNQKFAQAGYYSYPVKSEAIGLFLSLSKEEVERVKSFDKPCFTIYLHGVRDTSLDKAKELHNLLKQVISDISQPICTLLDNWESLVERVSVEGNFYLISLKDETKLKVSEDGSYLGSSDGVVFSTETERKVIAIKSKWWLATKRQLKAQQEREKLADTINDILTKEKEG